MPRPSSNTFRDSTQSVWSLTPKPLPNHQFASQASQLADALIRMQVKLFLPMHGFFEVTSAVMCEKRIHTGGLRATESITEDRPLTCTYVPIDMAFVDRYTTGEMPDLESGDMIFVMLAKVDHLDLITEDRTMLKEARKLGVNAYTIAEYSGVLLPDRKVKC